MNRPIQENRLLRLLRSELNEQAIPAPELEALFGGMSLADWDAVMQLAAANRVCPMLMGAVCRNPGMRIPMQMGQYLHHSLMQSSMAFYQKFSLVCSLLEQMRKEGIRGYVIKGVVLSALYPTVESRTFSDIDLYIPDQAQYDKLIALFHAAGFQKEQDDLTDYHESFRYESGGVSSETEVHYRLTTSWGSKAFDQALDAIYREGLTAEPSGTQELMGVEIPTLPVTLECLYLLMHLFQHFMNKGFGLRLFLDWTAFWNKRGSEVNTERFAGWIRQLRLGKFVDAINRICVDALGMGEPACGWFSEDQGRSLADELLADVFSGGEFGAQDKNRMVVTARKSGIGAYALELHRQTRKRFPRLSRFWPLLPVLWVLSAVIFEYNNVFRRKISLGAVFASSNQRNQLVQKMHIFDER